MAFKMFPGRDFEQSMKTTAPIIKGIPQNVREAFNISEVYESGIFQLENIDGMKLYDRTYVFSDINYKKKDISDKKTILLDLMDFLNFMSADFKIVVASEYRDMTEFISQIFSDMNQGEYPDISKGIKQLITQKINEGELKDLEKVMYLTVTCRAKSLDDAWVYFKGLDIQIEDLFLKMESIILPLNGQQRLATLSKFFYQDKNNEPLDFDEHKDVLLDVLPTSIDAGNKDYLEFNNNNYVTVLFARRYGSSLNEEDVIHKLTRVSYASYLTLDIAPVDKEVLDEKLKNANMNNERSIADEIEAKTNRGQLATGVSYQKSKKKDELERYMSQTDDNNENCFLMSLYVVISASSIEELAVRVDEMIDTAKICKVYLDTANYTQLKAFNTALPIGCRMVKYPRAILSSSMVAFQPFYAQDLCEPGGIFYGKNRTTGHLVFGNRKNLPSPHGLIVGITGSGKSFFIKSTEIAQTLLMTSDDIIAIDPQNELEYICNEFNGQFIDFTPKAQVYLNPLEIPEEVFEDENRHEQFIASQSEWACSFCEAAMDGIEFTSEHHADIDKCIRSMYTNIFNEKKLKKQPTLVDLRAEIKKKLDSATYENDKNRILKLYNSLEEFTEGSYDMFAHETNVKTDSRFVAYGLAHVKEKLWEPIMITISHFLATRMEFNKKLQRATHFIVDEGQIVTAHGGSAEILLNAILTFRKFGGMCTIAVQNLMHVMEHPRLRDMFENCGMKAFFDLGGVSSKELMQIQKLSQTEYNTLAQNHKGEALIAWNKKIVLVDLAMSKDNILYDKFSTNFHEKALEKENKTYENEQDINDQKMFEPVLNQREEAKEKIKQMASWVAISSTDVATSLSISDKEARDILQEMCMEKILCSDISAGTEYYKLR